MWTSGKWLTAMALNVARRACFTFIALEERFDFQQQAGLHGHAAPAEPVPVEIVQRVAILVRKIKIVLVILENPFGFGRAADPARRR